MFRALCSHHQEVKLYYTVSGRWPSGAQVESGLCTGRPPAEYDDTRWSII